MKILLVNKFHYMRGGAERVYFETKNILEKQGHQVVCFSMLDDKNVPSEQSKYFVENTDFGDMDNWFKKALRYIYYPEAAQKIEALIESEKPDIAHLHNISHYLTASILKPLRDHKIPVVQTLHDYQIICPNYHLFVKGKVCERCKNHRYYNAVMHKCLRNQFFPSLLGALELTAQWLFQFYRERVDAFISPSQFLADKLKSWNVKQPISVIHNFVDTKSLMPDFTDEGYVVCVSRLSYEKGLSTLIKAVRKAPEIKLKLIGDGPDRKSILEYLRLKQVRNVEYLGAKYGDELFDIVKKSRLAIVPSENFENCPMFVLEAMALGKPVLASNLGGLAEMVRPGFNGWLFNPGDIKGLRAALREHFLDKNLEELGQNARKFVEENYSAEKYYKELIDLYNKLKN